MKVFISSLRSHSLKRRGQKNNLVAWHFYPNRHFFFYPWQFFFSLDNSRKESYKRMKFISFLFFPLFFPYLMNDNMKGDIFLQLSSFIYLVSKLKYFEEESDCLRNSVQNHCRFWEDCRLHAFV